MLIPILVKTQLLIYLLIRFLYGREILNEKRNIFRNIWLQFHNTRFSTGSRIFMKFKLV